MKRLNSNERRLITTYQSSEKAETAKRDKKPENNPSGNRLVTDERMAELKDRLLKLLQFRIAAFKAIYKDGCYDCGDWIDTLINCYSEEVVNALGNNPYEVFAELEDIWETMEFEDYRTGVCLTYKNWAEYFAGEFAHIIYDELIKAKHAKNT